MKRNTLVLGSLLAVIGTIGACAVLALALIVGFLATLAIDRWAGPVETAQVAARRWRREIRIERFQEATRSAPCDKVPVGGLGFAGHWTHRHGLPERHHASTCRYQTLDWDPAEPRVTTGTDDPRTWPALPPACSSPRPGCEREKDRTEVLTVTLTATGRDPVECEVSEVRWALLPVGSQVAIGVGALSGRLHCGQLRP